MSCPVPQMTDSKTVSVYTDGACPSNPSPTGGIGIYNPSTGIGIGCTVQDENMTNNRAEHACGNYGSNERGRRFY